MLVAIVAKKVATLVAADDLRWPGSEADLVKRLNKGNSAVERGFERELDAMGDIKHRNIVMLHGYYASPDFNFLAQWKLRHIASWEFETSLLAYETQSCCWGSKGSVIPPP